jgi:hypothetical protein
MTQIEQLKQDLAALQQKLETLEAAEKVKDWPQYGDNYLYLQGNAEIRGTTYDGGKFDLAAKETGNCFRTREEAETELEVRKIVHKLRTSPGRVDHSGDHQHAIGWGYSEVTANIFCNPTNGFLVMRWGTKESCQTAIDSVGAENIVKAAKWLARV